MTTTMSIPTTGQTKSAALRAEADRNCYEPPAHWEQHIEGLFGLPVFWVGLSLGVWCTFPKVTIADSTFWFNYDTNTLVPIRRRWFRPKSIATRDDLERYLA